MTVLLYYVLCLFWSQYLSLLYTCRIVPLVNSFVFLVYYSLYYIVTFYVIFRTLSFLNDLTNNHSYYLINVLICMCQTYQLSIYVHLAFVYYVYMATLVNMTA